jgi:hypothetical protein
LFGGFRRGGGGGEEESELVGVGDVREGSEGEEGSREVPDAYDLFEGVGCHFIVAGVSRMELVWRMGEDCSRRPLA